MNEKNSFKPVTQLYSSNETLRVSLLFDNLIWLTTREAAVYLRKSVNAIHLLVNRRQIKARKFQNRLYFKKKELDYLLETSNISGG